MIRQEDVFKIGRLTKPHGVRGEINFSFTTDVWDRVDADYLILLVDGILVPFFLEEYRFRGEHGALLKFVDLDTIDAVQEYAGTEVYFPYALTPGEDESDYTWQYFVGFRVEETEAGDLGEIISVDESTENVLFEVSTARGPVLIPAVEAFIQGIDHNRHIVRMALPEGLLELE